MWRSLLESFAREHFEHPAWGTAHSRRVYESAVRLAVGSSIDDDVLFAAAYVHDAGAFPEFRAEGVDHAERSVQVAPAILRTVGFPVEKVAATLEVVGHHMFYSTVGPSRESIVFRDADTLEFMGAVGVARILSIVGIDDWTPDLPSAVALIERFAEELPAALTTEQARTVGDDRRAESVSFLAALRSQTFDMAAV